MQITKITTAKISVFSIKIIIIVYFKLIFLVSIFAMENKTAVIASFEYTIAFFHKAFSSCTAVHFEKKITSKSNIQNDNKSFIESKTASVYRYV